MFRNSRFSIQKHPENRAKRVSAISIVIQTLRDLYARAKVFDPFALKAERKKIRTALDIQGKERIKKRVYHKFVGDIVTYS